MACPILFLRQIWKQISSQKNYVENEIDINKKKIHFFFKAIYNTPCLYSQCVQNVINVKCRVRLQWLNDNAINGPGVHVSYKVSYTLVAGSTVSGGPS